MSSLVPRRFTTRRPAGGLLVALAVGAAVVVGMLDVVPVRSQALTLEALRTGSTISLDDPWTSVWSTAQSQDVPLSAQNISFPFGGGTVDALTVRALHDEERLYILLEWEDAEPNDAVNGFEHFSDAAAVQFPAAGLGEVPPFTMGGPGQPVNIWQWKAVRQADLADGFSTLQDRYPDTYTDGYQNGDDPLYKPALFLGNPVAQRDLDTPIENLVAESFGTLTSDAVQDVQGVGVWQDGRWRALFVRQFEPADTGLARFAEGETTSVAFAVWDGAADDRNGQKSIAPFIDLTVGTADAGSSFGGTQLVIVLLAALGILGLGGFVFAANRSGRGA